MNYKLKFIIILLLGHVTMKTINKVLSINSDVQSLAIFCFTLIPLSSQPKPLTVIASWYEELGKFQCMMEIP